MGASSVSFWQGVVTVWGILTVLATGYVAIDIRQTPEDPVMKWGFVIVTVFTGPLGAFLYVLGCREPLPGTHEAFVHAAWRQVLGSTMHCVAGDGLGIVAAAVIASLGHWPWGSSLIAEYTTGFLFGWTIFQALFMKSMAGGSYPASLRNTVWPEFLSMNGVMAGMALVMGRGMPMVPRAEDPATPEFWFVMGMALTAGLLIAYPINAWLVHRGLKHGMMTVRPHGRPVPLASGLFTSGQALRPGMAATPHDRSTEPLDAAHATARANAAELRPMALLTLGILGLGIWLGLV